jgi:hypothetical protein
MQDINSTLNTNFAKLGFYSDQQSLSYATISREMIDRFAADGYGGVLFEITVGINTDGTLQNKLTYNELYSLMDYADKKGLKTGILPNWNFNGGNADYIGQIALGQTRPPEFNINNLLNSMKQFINLSLPTFKSHGLDILYLSNNSPDFFASEYKTFWIDTINSFRSVYSGAISNQVFSTGKNLSESLIGKVAIWDLLDGIGVVVKHYVSSTPIYNFDEIVSGYFGNKLSGDSLVNELISASTDYKKPLLLIASSQSMDNALDGGTDPTKDQVLQNPLPINPELQKLAFTTLFQVISNNLNGSVSSVSIGNYEPWTLGNYDSLEPSSSVTKEDIALAKNWKYFDMSLFPSLAENAIKEYLNNQYSFKVSENTFGSTGNDIILTKLGNNSIYLKGGFDTVKSGIGNDNFYISKLYQINIKFQYGVWITDPKALTNIINIDLGNNASYSIKFTPSEILLNSTGYWNYNSVNLNLPADTKLDKIIFSLESGGFAHINNIFLNNIKIDNVTGTHSIVESWSSAEWVVNGDKYTFDLSSFIKNNYQGKTTVIDGGVGVDKIYFENVASVSDFKLTVIPNKVNFYDIAGKYPPVETTNVERLIFSDKSIAFDLNGNAGITTKILGSVFGKESVSNKNYVGIGLHFLDAGWSYDNLAGLALDAAGAKTNDQIVSLLWTNVIGTKPTAADKAPYIALLENGMTAGALAHLAADSSYNITNINLVGLAQTGIEYIPVT